MVPVVIFLLVLAAVATFLFVIMWASGGRGGDGLVIKPRMGDGVYVGTVVCKNQSQGGWGSGADILNATIDFEGVGKVVVSYDDEYEAQKFLAPLYVGERLEVMFEEGDVKRWKVL